jgi:hypothetical protein
VHGKLDRYWAQARELNRNRDSTSAGRWVDMYIEESRIETLKQTGDMHGKLDRIRKKDKNELT